MPILENNPKLCDGFWRFVRGDMEDQVFENWLYSSNEIEDALGEEGYLAAISVNFYDAKRLAEFKAYLSQHLFKPACCDCHSQPDDGSVSLGEWPSDRFEIIEREIDGIWWLHRLECKECKTMWHLAAEERIFDVWLLKRYPIASRSQVQTYRDLLMSAKASGSKVWYFDPTVSWEIPAAIRDLAEETPGIACSEIERILPIDVGIVRQHARVVASKYKLDINLGA
ncbi:hypothetical protein [Jannaschia donghaensis]|uniref:Uncharacterized protein n=1 Tax=Jannaschia donghaensis TaxID=420998 RepID=A0A0M6YGF3_9RHOB|nr:hypothetical protein [Jannaschia donghaensis]CTQ49431.1 hypothetical protein JDO7802_01445 [Jannaschia donghaensis]